MKKTIILATLALASLGAAEQKVGIVNLHSCFADTKLGKQEQNAFETMRKQFVSLAEDTEKQLKEIAEKLQDKEHLDGLSKEGEDALKTKFAQLENELGRYQQQYHMFINQGQGKVFQTIIGGVNHAAEQLAAAKGYHMILNKEACFFSSPALDITAEVVKEMDKSFDEEAKKQAQAAPKVEEPSKK